MVIHSENQSLFSIGVFSNRQLAKTVLLTIFLQLSIIYIPFLQNIFHTEALTLRELIIILLISSIVFLATDVEKSVRRSFIKQRNIRRDAKTLHA
jgi:P-type Ca2+ transporter type 2C